MPNNAINYLLIVLKEQSPIRYSRFYDGGDDTRNKLIDGLGLSEAEADWECPEDMMDQAVWHLVQKGIVSKTDLPDKLADGEQDYEIALTEKGKMYVQQTTLIPNPPPEDNEDD